METIWHHPNPVAPMLRCWGCPKEAGAWLRTWGKATCPDCGKVRVLLVKFETSAGPEDRAAMLQLIGPPEA